MMQRRKRIYLKRLHPMRAGRGSRLERGVAMVTVNFIGVMAIPVPTPMKKSRWVILPYSVVATYW
jgi:hypothetical protein